MTPEQQDAIDLFALEYGRTLVHEGYADQNVRLTIPGGGHWHITPDGIPHPRQPDHSIDWNQ